MNEMVFVIPEQIVDAKEAHALVSLTETYEKMIEPSAINNAIAKATEKLSDPLKNTLKEITNSVSANELFIKCIDVLGRSFQTLEQFAAKVTLSEAEVVKQIDAVVPKNHITSLDDICLARSYDIQRVVNKNKLIDIIAALAEGAATGAPGFAGIPFNIVLSTFLFYRAVQSVALFYGYDVKNDPTELQIASEVFACALNPSNRNGSDLSNAIAKVMLLTTATSVKQTVKKGWTQMAEKGGVYLLLTQIRALANSSAKKALEKAGKTGLEKTVFSEVLEQLGKKLTQKAIGKAIPYIGAIIGAAIDTSQMISILNYAEIFYCKRFILEKRERIAALCGNSLVEDEIEEIIIEETIADN